MVHNSSLMTNPTVKLSFTGTSVAPVRSIATMTLSGTSGAGDTLDFWLFNTLNGVGGSGKSISVPLSGGANASMNADTVVAAINNPVTGYGPYAPT